MTKSIHIIDTNQLIDNPKIIGYILKKYHGQKVYLIENVENELDKLQNKHIHEERWNNKAKKIKEIIDSYKNNKYIIFWKSTSEKIHADPAIIQLILEKLCDNTINYIDVYTADKHLAELCYQVADSPTISHESKLQVWKCKDGKPTKFNPNKNSKKNQKNNNNDNNKDKTSSGPDKVTVIKNPDVMMWRNSKGFEGVNTKNSSHQKTTSDGTEVTHFYVKNTLEDDVVRLYKETPIHKGDIIKATILLFDRDNIIDIGIVLWNKTSSKLKTSDIYIRLEANKKTEIELKSDGEYDYANIDLCVKRDSIEKYHYKGTDGYLYDFRIIHKA